jgi:predicted dehydrogenase
VPCNEKAFVFTKTIDTRYLRGRILTQAASKYKVITQMGDQGASCEGMRTMREWFEAGLIGDIHTVYNWTNRPVWPQGIPWPKQHPRFQKN